MTPEKILEIARKTVRLTWVNDSPEDLIAFAQAIIEAEQESSDEPVAWLGLLDDFCLYNKLYFDKQDALDDGHSFVEPLYRHPPPARKLTDEEILAIGNRSDCAMDFARRIERRANGEEE